MAECQFLPPPPTTQHTQVTGVDNYRQEVLILLTGLTMLDGEPVTAEERLEAKKVNKERIAEAAEAARIAAAEAAAAAAAAEEED